MKAQFNQNNLGSGYAHVILIKDDGDHVFYAAGDAIGLGKDTEDGLKFFGKNGAALSEFPEALDLTETPLYEGEKVTFLLPPTYVDNMVNGTYVVSLLDASGKEKNRAKMRAEVENSQSFDAEEKIADSDETKEAKTLWLIKQSGEQAEADANISFALNELPDKKK